MKKSLTKYTASDMIVCWLKQKQDLSILLNEGWYRIPVKTKLDKLFKVKYLSFYQSWAFGKEKCIIKHYGTIDNISVLMRRKLFPDEKLNSKSDNVYYKIEMKDMNILKKPIYSKRARRVIFIYTTLEKLLYAKELNDLYHGSPLEDKLWVELKHNDIAAERQFFYGKGKNFYCLDFAALCKKGNLDIECDGDLYHINKEKAVKDNIRDNFLTKNGWSIVRYSSKQLNDTQECIKEISEIIYNKGGMK